MMNQITKAYLEIGIIKDLFEEKIITEDEMNLAIIEIMKNNELEELKAS